jgi:hypothetical protein
MSDVIGVEGAGDADTRLEWTAVLAFQPRPLVLANRAAAAVLERTHLSRGPSAVLEPPPPPPMLADRPAVAPASKPTRKLLLCFRAALLSPMPSHHRRRHVCCHMHLTGNNMCRIAHILQLNN